MQSTVDTRTLLELEESSVKRDFPVWWPCGKQLIAPLVGATTVSHGLAFVMSSNTNWLISGLSIIAIGPYTAVMLREDIAALRKASTIETRGITAHFYLYHHFRLVLAVVGFGVSLLTLSK